MEIILFVGETKKITCMYMYYERLVVNMSAYVTVMAVYAGLLSIYGFVPLCFPI